MILSSEEGGRTERGRQSSRQIVVALFKFWVVGSEASVGKNCHKGHTSATRLGPASLLGFRGPFSKPKCPKRRTAGKGNESVVRCVWRVDREW